MEKKVTAEEVQRAARLIRDYCRETICCDCELAISIFGQNRRCVMTDEQGVLSIPEHWRLGWE